MSDVTKGTPIEKFKRPDGIVEVEVDAWSGLRPGPGTQQTITELFIEGTPGRAPPRRHALGARDRRRDRPPVGRGLHRPDGAALLPRLQQRRVTVQPVAARQPGLGGAGRPRPGRPRRPASAPRPPTSSTGSSCPSGAPGAAGSRPAEVCEFQPPVCEEPGGGPPTPEPSDVVPCVTLPPPPSAEPTKPGWPQADRDPRARRATVPRRPAASCRERCSRSPCRHVPRPRAPVPTEPPSRTRAAARRHAQRVPAAAALSPLPS